MNEPLYSQDLSRNSNAVMGFVLGAAVGAGIALLLAPCSGTETRRKLGDKARQLSTSMRDGLEQTKNRLGELKDDVNTAVTTGRDAFVRERDARYQAPSTDRYEASPSTTRS